MKKPKWDQLTEEQQDLLVVLLDLLKAANKMPIIMALLENFLERRVLTEHLKVFSAELLSASVDGVPGVAPAILAQNREYRAWLTKALRERTPWIKPGMSPAMTERDLLDAELDAEIPF